MKIESIRWKARFPTKAVSAESAYNALEAVRQKHGGDLTDDAVVDAARAKRSVLHPLFEWDDTIAAQEHRRHQARVLIASIEVSYREAPDAPVRAFQVQDRAKAGAPERSVYRTTEAVMSDPVARDQLIATAIREAMAFRRRFKHLHELQPLFEALDSVVESVGASV